MADDTPRPTPRRDQASVGEVIDYVKTYAKQETVGPLKGAGRWIGVGAAAAVSFGLGLALLMLGLLRLLQSEVDFFNRDRLTWLPYLIVLVVTALVMGLAATRINKTFLDKEDQQ
jgi:hypothetical protein